MKFIICVIAVLTGWLHASGQSAVDTIGGEVSYTTSQSIYVRFESTKNISVGDTLYFFQNGLLHPVLVVKNLSSTSCVGSPIADDKIEKGDRIVAKPNKVVQKETRSQELVLDMVPQLDDIKDPEQEEEIDEAIEVKKTVKQSSGIKGRLSAASYINLSDFPENDKQRMRYTFTMNTNQIGNTKLSFETYMSFRHTLNEWQEVKDNFNRAFKIYTLALQYDVNENMRVWAGRKINFNISNIGAIDGIQAEKKWNKILTGVFAGSRPDHTEYNVNPKLLQFGAYAGYSTQTKHGQIQNTVAIAEQRNDGKTDRRFAYFQHINSAIRKLNVFTSFEFDLYTLANDQPKNTFNISSAYFSLRYRVSDKLSVFGSYDARKNIIYYETYKNFIDQLLEDETRQGLRFSFNYRPLKYVTLGASAGYRYQKDNPDDSKNLHSYLTWSRVPGVNMSATLSATLIQSPYLDGTIYGIRMSRDIIDGKLYGEIEFRHLGYRYKNVELPLSQYLAGASLSWRFTKKLSFALHYEGEIRRQNISHRINTNIIQRF